MCVCVCVCVCVCECVLIIRKQAAAAANSGVHNWRYCAMLCTSGPKPAWTDVGLAHY